MEKYKLSHVTNGCKFEAKLTEICGQVSEDYRKCNFKSMDSI